MRRRAEPGRELPPGPDRGGTGPDGSFAAIGGRNPSAPAASPGSVPGRDAELGRPPLDEGRDM